MSESTKPRILVVEDDVDLLKMLSKILSTVGNVTVAADGMDAVTVLERDPTPDLVVTDLMMPRMDGLTLARKMKDTPKLAKIPVIILTAKGTPRDVITGINAGARHYLTKPFKHDELIEKVQRALGKKPKA
jgi:CheY-like chemotaxis protein